MVVLIQSENHAANKEKTAGRYQFDTHPTGIGLRVRLLKRSLILLIAGDVIPVTPLNL